MKVRRDFVTNSSSSSFIISKRCLDNDQIEAIREHWELGKKIGMVDLKWDSPWDIEENDEFITGYTFMDNFNMYDFFNKIDVKEGNITWSERPFDLFFYKDNKDDEENNKDWRDLLHED